MLPRRFQAYDSYPWSPSEISKRGVTAPRPEKCDNIYLPSRVPTSSSKYNEFHIPSTKVSIKGSGWKSYKPREPVRTVNSYHMEPAKFRETKPKPQVPYNNSPLPEEIEHIWEEGSKRPKTQNEKCRRKNSTQGFNGESSEVFPPRAFIGQNNIYDVPIIVIRDDKNRRVVSAKRNIVSKVGQRPSTFKPGKSNLITSLDQEFLDLFQM